MRSVFFYLPILSIWNCSLTETIKVNLEDEIIIPKSYIVYKVSDSILIDGRDDEFSWKKAEFTDDFMDIQGIKTPKQRTNVKMIWDEEFLYVFAKLKENHIWGDITKRDAVIYHNNDFEVFLSPTKDVSNYGEIEINALGTVWDLFLNKPYRIGGKADNNWDIKGLRSAIHIEGSINDYANIDDFWSVEMAIPLGEYAELKKNKTIPIDGEKWRINFSRVQWEFEVSDNKYTRKKVDGKLLPEYNWVWSNQGEINMHIPENWGFLQFSENSLDSKISYQNSKEIITEQVLYAFFRKVSFKELKYLKDLKNNSKINFQPILFDNRKISCSFLKTESGFIITAEDYKNNVEFSISESGIIKDLNND